MIKEAANKNKYLVIAIFSSYMFYVKERHASMMIYSYVN